MTRVKICGVTHVADALRCADAGADAIGLNFWPESKRRCDPIEAARIVDAVGERARIVAVFVDADLHTIEQVRSSTGISWVQLHGREEPALLAALLPNAYKAVHPIDDASATAALRYLGDELLVDASVPGMPGGTGVRCDWSVAERLARERNVWLAGGLVPDNVAEAIARVRPYGVDVASGVERAPGVKDPLLVERFVRAARAC